MLEVESTFNILRCLYNKSKIKLSHEKVCLVDLYRKSSKVDRREAHINEVKSREKKSIEGLEVRCYYSLYENQLCC